MSTATTSENGESLRTVPLSTGERMQMIRDAVERWVAEQALADTPYVGHVSVRCLTMALYEGLKDLSWSHKWQDREELAWNRAEVVFRFLDRVAGLPADPAEWMQWANGFACYLRDLELDRGKEVAG